METNGEKSRLLVNSSKGTALANKLLKMTTHKDYSKRKIYITVYLLFHDVTSGLVGWPNHGGGHCILYFITGTYKFLS